MGAGKRVYVYREDESGKYRPILVTKPGELRHMSKEQFEDQIIKGLHDLECEQGSRFNGVGQLTEGKYEYSPSMLKKVWIDDRKRYERIERRQQEALQRARGQ